MAKYLLKMGSEAGLHDLRSVQTLLMLGGYRNTLKPDPHGNDWICLFSSPLDEDTMADVRTLKGVKEFYSYKHR